MATKSPARTDSSSAHSDLASAKQLAIEIITHARDRAELDRVWFPNGIDSFALKIAVGKDGIAIDLALAGPKPQARETAVTSVVAGVEADVASEQAVMDAAKNAATVPANLNDCNKFVKAVAGAVGIGIDPNADAEKIVGDIQAAPWQSLPLGDNRAAMAKAAEGKLVLAGMKKGEFTTPHSRGHVAVVHGHEVAGHPGFPHASWGSLDGTGAQAGTFDGSIRDTFPVVDLGKIHYAFQDI